MFDKIWFKNKKYTSPKDDVIDVLDQLKDQLNINFLNIKKELHHLTNYFNKIPIIYLIINYNGSIINSNNSFLNSISCDKDECVGFNVSDFIHPDDINIYNTFLSNLKLTNNSDDISESMFRLLSKYGGITYIKWGGVNLKDDQLLMLFGQDVTSEIGMCDQLKEYISQENLILNNYPGSVMSVNLQGIVTGLNSKAEKSIGYKKSDIINKTHVYDIFPDKNLMNSKNLSKMREVYLKKSDNTVSKSYVLLLPMLDKIHTMMGYLIIWYNKNYIEYIKSV